ncbi:MAG: DUF115 domain-containing protein [Candidatus Aramenus sp.]|nr:DUF115 domain-containing protein [Candidatus Aramenus sp.]
MNFYSRIRSVLGFSEEDDYKSASILNQMLRDNPLDLLEEMRGRKVAVVGAGPSLEEVREIDADVVVSADGATNFLVKRGVIPEFVVTDLDGIEVFPKESVYVVLAHGDNVHLLGKVYNMENVIGTCQVMPFGRLNLFGGFTDGDRAVVLAKRFGAREIVLYGMDLESNFIGKFSKPYLKDNVPVSWMKREKLKIAKAIIDMVLK